MNRQLWFKSHDFFWPKKLFDFNHDLNQWLKSARFKSANPVSTSNHTKRCHISEKDQSVSTTMSYLRTVVEVTSNSKTAVCWRTIPYSVQYPDNSYKPWRLNFDQSLPAVNRHRSEGCEKWRSTRVSRTWRLSTPAADWDLDAVRSTPPDEHRQVFTHNEMRIIMPT